MLLEIRSETKRSAIFEALNIELGYFLQACVTARIFTRNLFSAKLKDSIYDNEPTKIQFKKLWDVIKPLSTVDRQNIADEYKRCQFIQRYYDDKTCSFPVLPRQVGKVIDDLTKHLFSRSSGLVGIQSDCGETLHQHFQNFCTANRNICCFCGTSELAQVRAGVDINDQWRAANDHLLSKKDYPLFVVHPDNLVPLCETCNSKAKLAIDLLNIKQKDHPDERRLSFYPFIENCNEYVGVKVDEDEMRLTVKLLMNAPTPEIEEKLSTWNSVYSIQGRVEGKFANLAVIADNDCYASNLADFRQKIEDKATSCKNNCRLEAWNFWKYRLYEWLHSNGNGAVEALWNSIESKRSDADAAAVYGI